MKFLKKLQEESLKKFLQESKKSFLEDFRMSRKEFLEKSWMESLEKAAPRRISERTLSGIPEIIHFGIRKDFFYSWKNHSESFGKNPEQTLVRISEEPP